MISFTVHGAEAVAKRMLVASTAVKVAMPDALDKAALLVVRSAKRNAPVDTGHLRTAIQPHRVSAGQVDVTSHADYSVYQEFGTSRMAAHPFMRPALDENAAQIKALLGHRAIAAVQGSFV